MLQAQALSVEVGGRLVVESADFTVMPRDKVGLVGRNGAGKTSLFRVLGGETDPSAGRVVRKGAFGYLPQDPRIAGVLDGRTAVAHILSGRGVDAELERIEKLRIAMEELPDDRNVARYTRAEEQFRTNGGYAADSEARALAAGLGIGPSRIEHPIGVLSGGERRRVELARILFAGSDVLCLDEPTNHLDVDAKEWLMGFLRAYRGALLVISHDLDLLDEAITRVLHLDRPEEAGTGHLVEYKGTYTEYVSARASDEAQRSKMAARQSKEIARLQKFVDRFGAKATKAAAAHSMEKRIARLEADKVDEVRGDRVLRVRFPPPPTPGRTVVDVAGLSKSYGGPAIFSDVSFDLGRGERLLVLGLNGAGKTSLLRILAAETDADDGAVTWGHHVTVGYYAQEHDNLRVDESLLDNIRREVPPEVVLTETQLRGLLGMFGLSGEKVFQEAGTLSGGEKTKLALSMLMVGRNNVLLLDEPTNNLDPGSRQSVADSLATWPGALILVSHDTEFVEQLRPTKVLLMPDGEVDYFNPGWLDLVALLEGGGRELPGSHRGPDRTRPGGSSVGEMRTGVFSSTINDGTVDDVVAEARQAEADGFDTYWASQIFGNDALTALAVVGREVPRIELGTSVVPTYPRHPMMLAQQALTVNATSGGRLCLGIGLSHQIVIETMMGMSFDKPVRHLREYLGVLGPLTRGEAVGFEGDTYKVHAAVNVKGATPFPVVVAALGPQMLRATAELADGTLTWCTGPQTLADHIVPTINAAAEAAGRPAPRVIAALPVCVTDDVDGARARAAEVFAVYGQLPSYRAMLDREGAAGAADIAVVGSAAEVSERIAALADIGVTDFAAVEFGGNPDEAAATRAALVAALPR